MNIDEQVEYLMQGADFGDSSIADAMAEELRERLIESEKTGKLYGFIAAMTPPQPICIWGTPSPCANYASSRNLGIRFCL